MEIKQQKGVFIFVIAYSYARKSSINKRIDDYFVTVTDNSLSDAKIVAGDVLVVRMGAPAANEQTVLATVKTGKLSLLKWGADAIKKIGQGDIADSTQCPAVVGIVVGVLRAF